METVRDYVNQGLSIRAKERLKVRQPLGSVTVPTLGQFVNFEDILTEELNVKEVKAGGELALDLEVTPELKREGLMREVVRHVQNARKQAGLNVDDRIKLSLITGEAELKKAIAKYEETIATETLAETLTEAEYGYSVDLKVEGMPVKVSLQKA
jgi:isoleucyl-tRNA synthetase